MGAIASQITSLASVYSIVYSDADQRKHQSSESLAFVQGIHRGPVNSPHKWPVTRKMFPFDDVIMACIDLILAHVWLRLWCSLGDSHLTHWGRDKMAATLADDTFICKFVNENILMSITISLKFFPKGPINNIPALVQIMAGDKPLSEPMIYCHLDSWEQTSVKYTEFSFKKIKYFWKCHLQYGSHLLKSQ